jgi:hypothetical protein
MVVKGISRLSAELDKAHHVTYSPPLSKTAWQAVETVLQFNEDAGACNKDTRACVGAGMDFQISVSSSSFRNPPW